MNQRAWVGVGLGFLLGVAVGASLMMHFAEPAVVVEEMRASPREEPALANPVDQAAWLRKELATTRSALDAERAQHRETRHSLDLVMAQRADALATLEIAHVPLGAEKPVPFPADAGVFSEAVFREAVKALVETCGAQLGWANARVDCDEYPCHVFFDEVGESAPDYSINDCAPWATRYPNSAVRMEGAADGGDGHIGLFALPPEDPMSAAIFFRSRDRFTRQFR